MRIASVVGTRPQLIKAAALQPELRARHHEIFVDTGQHWDDALAGSFFRELGLARPDHSLDVGGGSHAEQTATMLTRLEPILLAERPDAVLVYGDTNSTLAGALTAAKLGIPVAHVEAGLRSFDRRMPEELNRVVADHLATWAFAPTPTAVANLRAEGISRGVTLVGDLMQDLAARIGVEVRDPAVLAEVEAGLAAGGVRVGIRPGAYLFATIHRAENRSPAAVVAWVAMLDLVATADRPVILALHPGTAVALSAAGLQPGPNVVIVGPRSYRASLALQMHAAAVITDSGGIQREAAWLGVPCLILRSSTEWPEMLAAPGGGSAGGGSVLVGLDRDRAAVELERLAPSASAPAAARRRAAAFALAPAGAGEAIASALAASTAEPGSAP